MDKVTQRILNLLEDFGADVPNGVDTLIKNLGFDSLDELEFLMQLDDEFATEIPDVDAQAWKTVADAVAYIKERTLP